MYYSKSLQRKWYVGWKQVSQPNFFEFLVYYQMDVLLLEIEELEVAFIASILYHLLLTTVHSKVLVVV